MSKKFKLPTWRTVYFKKIAPDGWCSIMTSFGSAFTPASGSPLGQFQRGIFVIWDTHTPPTQQRPYAFQWCNRANRRPSLAGVCCCQAPWLLWRPWIRPRVLSAPQTRTIAPILTANCCSRFCWRTCFTSFKCEQNCKAAEHCAMFMHFLPSDHSRGVLPRIQHV